MYQWSEGIVPLCVTCVHFACHCGLSQIPDTLFHSSEDVRSCTSVLAQLLIPAVSSRAVLYYAVLYDWNIQSHTLLVFWLTPMHTAMHLLCVCYVLYEMNPFSMCSRKSCTDQTHTLKVCAHTCTCVCVYI
jgi:hypothetical protein